MIGRTIRPRPLSYTERIPVVFLNHPKEGVDEDRLPVDPALEQFLRNCDDQREREQNGLLKGLETSRKRRKKRHQAAAKQQQACQPQAQGVKQGRPAGAAAGPRGSAQCGAGPNDPHAEHHNKRQQEQPQPHPVDGATGAATAAAVSGIAVPTCREISDYASNEEAMARADARKAADAAVSAVPLRPLLSGVMPDVSPCLASQGSLGLDPAGAYVIYQDLLRERRVEPALLQYDMDEQDEKALAAMNAAPKGQAPKPGAAGGSRTPPTTRATTAAAAAAASSVPDEDGFEALIDALERAHFDALQQRKELWQPELKLGRVPKLPPTDKVLPWEAAVAALKQHQPPLPPLSRAIYSHWLKRRKQEGGPLLGYLWYEQPWKAISFQDRQPGHKGELGDMPFEATETKNSTRGGWNRIRIDKKEAYERLQEVREELELLRTTADQIRKRERLKKQLLKLYRAEMAAKLRLIIHGKHAAAGTAAAAAGATIASGAASAAAAGLGTACGGASTGPAPSAAAAPAAAARRAAKTGTPVAVAAAAHGGADSQAPHSKRRRLGNGAAATTAAVVEQRKAAAARGPLAAPMAASGGEQVRRAQKPQKEPPKPGEAAAAAAGSRKARVRKRTGGAGKPLGPSSAPSTSPTSSAASGSSESDSPSVSELQAIDAAAAAIHGRQRRPSTADAAGRGRQRSNARAVERSRPGAQRRDSAAAETAAKDDNEEEEQHAGVERRRGGSEETDTSSSPLSSGDGKASEDEWGEDEADSGSGLPSSSVSLSSFRSSDNSGRSNSSDGGGSNSRSASSASAFSEFRTSDEDSSSEEREDDKEEAGGKVEGAGGGESQRAGWCSRSRSRARSTGRGRARTGGSTAAAAEADVVDDDSGGQPSSDPDQEAEAGEKGEKEGQQQELRGRKGPRTAGLRDGGPAGRSRQAGEGLSSRRQQRQQQQRQQQQRQQQQRPALEGSRACARTRSRSATRFAAAASSVSPVRSGSPSPSRSPSTTRSSSPTRSGRSGRSSSSPEPSRSPSRSPPRPARRGSVAVANAVAATGRRGGVPPLPLQRQSRQRRLTNGGDDNRRGARRQGLRFSAGAAAARPNRELLELLKMQPESRQAFAEAPGGGAGADASAAGNKTNNASATRAAASAARDKAGAAATASQGAEGVVRRARGNSGGFGTGGGPGSVAPAARSPVTGSKRPLEPIHGTSAAAGGSPSPSHKKSKIGWRKELAALLGKSFAATSRFLLQRKQSQQLSRGPASATGDASKARDGSSGDGGTARGSVRRTSMLRERNGTS